MTKTMFPDPVTLIQSLRPGEKNGFFATHWSCNPTENVSLYVEIPWRSTTKKGNRESVKKYKGFGENINSVWKSTQPAKFNTSPQGEGSGFRIQVIRQFLDQM